MSHETEVFQVKFVMPNEEHTISIGSDQHLWDAANAAGITLPAMCHQGYCLTCAARLDNGGEVDQSDSLAYFPDDRAAGFVLLCTGKPRSNLTLQTHQQKEMREFRKQRKLIAPYSWSEE
jgi:ferredoxin